MSLQLHTRLEEERTRRGWSQQRLADQVGVTRITISRWEAGKTHPPRYYHKKLCEVFGLSAQQLGLEPVMSVLPTAQEAHLPIFDPAIPPPLPKGLVGRNGLLDHLKQVLQAGSRLGLTALDGLPGVGKTALAVALAHEPEVRARFTDGILWVGLGLRPNIPGLLARWGALFGISEQMSRLESPYDWELALRTSIGERRLLIFIDDVWNPSDMLAFQVGGPGCAYVLTTRFTDIASLFAGEVVTVPELGKKDGLALLSRLAPRAVEAEQEAAADLVQAVGGLPLALLLMGNRLRVEAQTGQTRRIQGAIRRLQDAGERMHLVQPQGILLSPGASLSLSAAIDTSMEVLDEHAREALYALSAFPPKPNTFSEEAALVVARTSTDTLDHLSDAGLLETSGLGRYTLHQTIHDYTWLHLCDLAPLQRFVTYFAHAVEVYQSDYETLEREMANVLAAEEVASAQNERETLVRIANGMAPFLEIRGMYKEAVSHLQRAHEVARTLDRPRALAETLLRLGRLAQKQGEYAQAQDSYQEGLDLARATGESRQICALLANLGQVAEKRGLYRQAEAYLQEGLELARRHDYREELCDILSNLGVLVEEQGNYPQAEACYQEGLSLARQLGDRERTCRLLNNLGMVMESRGFVAQAELYEQEALALAREIGHREWTIVLLINLGVAAESRKDYVQAQSLWLEGLAMARQLGHREYLSHLLCNLGEVAGKMGQFTDSEPYFQEALALARQIGKPRVIVYTLGEWGQTYLARADIEAAARCFQDMLEHIPEGSQEPLAIMKYGLARVAVALGNLPQALALGEESLRLYESLGHKMCGEVRDWLAALPPPEGGQQDRPASAPGEQ